MNTVVGTLAVLFTWLLFSLATCGWGTCALRFSAPAGGWRFGPLFWSGLLSSVALLQILNLFTPLNGAVTAALLLAGLALLVVHRKRIRFVGDARVPMLAGALTALGILWLANRALLPPYHYDSGLYHFSSIRWANEQPLPPGLGNLHGRLGYNQSYFLWVAFLNWFPWPGWGHHFANGLLLVAAILDLLILAGERPGQKTLGWGFLTAIPLLLWYGCNGQYGGVMLSSPTPDLAVFFLQVAAFAHLCQAGWRRAPEARSTSHGQSVSAVLALVTLLVLFKLSALVFSVGTTAVLCAFAGRPPRYRWWPALALSTAAAIGWLLRGAIATGYLVYPVAATAVPVGWKMPVTLVQSEQRWIRSWARWPYHDPDLVLASWRWLHPWWRACRHNVQFTTALWALCAVLALNLVFRPRASADPEGRTNARLLWAAAATAAASVVFWFCAAPDPRFLGASAWLVSWALLLAVLRRLPDHKSRWLTAAAVLSLGLALAAELRPAERFWVKIPAPAWAYPVPVQPMRPARTASGLKVLMPASGSQCWDAPLPCSPYYFSGLRLRGRTLADGFTFEPSSSLDERRGPEASPNDAATR